MNAIKITNKENHKKLWVNGGWEADQNVLLESLITFQQRCTTYTLLTKRGFKMAGDWLGLDFRDTLRSLFLPVPEPMYAN